MQSVTLYTLPQEILFEIVSYLDFPDQENLHYSCGPFFRTRTLRLPILDQQIKWLRATENERSIPVDELHAHHAFLRILNNIFTIEGPTGEILDRLVVFFVEELICSWMFPRTSYYGEGRINGSPRDTRIYHRRYPLLFRLAMLLRWNGVGPRIAACIGDWLESKWTEIENDAEIRQVHPIDFTQPPFMGSFSPRQEMVLYGVHSIALFPLIHLSPQSPASEYVFTRINLRSLNDEAWADPGYDRLKLWLTIPELWNLEIRHIGIKELFQPFRPYRLVDTLPLLQLVLDKASEFGGFPFRILNFVRWIEMTTPRQYTAFPDSRYWYEEGFVRARLFWNFKAFEFPGQYLHLLKRPFLDLIHGYMTLFGVEGLSDMILNMVHMVKRRSLRMRVLVARTVMSELLVYGYQFLTTEAIDAIVELTRDQETGQLYADRVRVDYTTEPHAHVIPEKERSSRRHQGR